MMEQLLNKQTCLRACLSAPANMRPLLDVRCAQSVRNEGKTARLRPSNTVACIQEYMHGGHDRAKWAHGWCAMKPVAQATPRRASAVIDCDESSRMPIIGDLYVNVTIYRSPPIANESPWPEPRRFRRLGCRN